MSNGSPKHSLWGAASRDVHLAVDRQDLARDYAGFVTGEIKRRARDVVGLDQAKQM